MNCIHIMLEEAFPGSFHLYFLAVEGILKGFDKLDNLVLDNCVEFLRGMISCMYLFVYILILVTLILFINRPGRPVSGDGEHSANRTSSVPRHADQPHIAHRRHGGDC
jgi:small nuclear ribonucleoprotein (snRNP)-like protein